MDKERLYEIMGDEKEGWYRQMAAMNYLGINIIGMPKISDLDGKRWFTYHVEYLMPSGKWGKFLFSEQDDEVTILPKLARAIKNIRKAQTRFEKGDYSYWEED